MTFSAVLRAGPSPADPSTKPGIAGFEAVQLADRNLLSGHFLLSFGSLEQKTF